MSRSRQVRFEVLRCIHLEVQACFLLLRLGLMQISSYIPILNHNRHQKNFLEILTFYAILPSSDSFRSSGEYLTNRLSLFGILFKKIFHPDRLSRFISSILRLTVKVLHILPNEDLVFHGETLLIMDLLAEMEDGSLINVEIQTGNNLFKFHKSF